MLVQTSSLSKIYQTGSAEVQALLGVDLEVAQGEFVAFMGPSGCGKSTLLHLLGCLDRPTNGRYLLNSLAVESLNDWELSRLRNERIGFIFQAFNLIAQHDVLENVELPLIYACVGKELRRDRAMEILCRLGLEDRMHHRPAELSGGEAQRVAIARALIVQPLLLLADEPTGNLDSETGKGIMELFTDLNSLGTTVLLVTHNRDLAHYAQRIIEMRDGRVVSDSKGDEP